ncbi:MAG: RnfABCDGE type electron transport complex subunit G [Eubacterium sp.]|nr:RnfABCDGE type electron transport complex subunit G [Eubacterium sp.]
MKALVTDCIKLVVITLVAGIILGAVYGITKEPIAQQEMKARQEAYKAVFPDASEFTDVEGFSEEEAADVLADYSNVIEDHEGDLITAAVEAKDASGALLGYIFNVTTAKGYGGNIQLTVGIQADGTVNGYSVLSISETAGLGMNAKTNQAWADQYKNKKVDHFEVVKDGSGNLNSPSEEYPGIDAISGATITSKAVTGAMNSCLAYFQSLEGGN